MAKGDVNITYDASEKIDKMYNKIDDIHTKQSVHISETKGEIKNISERVENLNDKFEKAMINIGEVIKTNTLRTEAYESRITERMDKHENDINETRTTMRTIRHVMGWVGAVISVMAGMIGWSVDNFLKSKVTTISTEIIDEKIESKVIKLLESYNLEIQYEKSIKKGR